MSSDSSRQIIRIHPQAPRKPAEGRPCNGCGVCCLAEPCPLGVVLSRSRTGACHAVRWDAAAVRYQCGAMADPVELLRDLLPASLAWLSKPVGRALGRLAGRWIAAGIGCDSNIEPEVLPASATMH
jgi:hypothetical protein